VKVEPRARGGAEIEVEGGDFLDGTPVLDLKPYLPYADRLTAARAAWADLTPSRLKVDFSAAASRTCRALGGRYPRLRTLIRQIVAQDPRPAFQVKRGNRDRYSARLHDLDVHWRVESQVARVERIDVL
jgi:hypothetical protein